MVTTQCLKCDQVQGLGVPSGGLFVSPKKRSSLRDSGCRERGSYRSCRGPRGRGIRRGGLNSPGQAVERGRRTRLDRRGRGGQKRPRLHSCGWRRQHCCEHRHKCARGGLHRKYSRQVEARALIGARVKAHPAILAKQQRASRFLIGDDVHPYRKRRGWRAVVVKLNGNSGMSVGAE